MARTIVDPSGDDLILPSDYEPAPATCWWCWLITSLLVAAAAVLVAALWWTASRPEVNAYPVWCDTAYAAGSGRAPLGPRFRPVGDEGYEPAIPPSSSSLDSRGSLADLLIAPARAQQPIQQPRIRAPLRESDRKQVEQYVLWRIAQADGSRIAYEMLDHDPIQELNLPDGLREYAQIMFENESRKHGAAGFYRLALAYLDTTAFDIALADKDDRSLNGHNRLVVPFCPYSDFVADTNPKIAYGYLVWAEQCDIVHPPLFARWMDAIVRESRWSEREVERLRSMARRTYDAATARLSPKKKREFCTGVISVDHPPYEVECERARNAREALKLGDAEQALNNMTKARACWRSAIDLARSDPEGAPAALKAQQQLQATTSTCKWTDASLATISRDYRARSGDLIHVKVIQQALEALGHYDGPIDGNLSPVTRAAIRKFQRSVGDDETDTLTPLETTVLMCNSAETTGDLVSMTTLGVMYAVGLGVEQNVDQAQQWLLKASNRRYADATYNLSILYGTGILLNSYRLCDVPRMPEQADRYLGEAAGQGHPIANALLSLYGHGSKYASLSPRERWTLIEMQQLENSAADRTGIYATKLAIVGARCVPDRSIR